MMKVLRIGTRGSALALAQTSIIAEKIRKRHPDLRLEIVRIKTTGDKMKDVAPAKIGGKGVFVKEIEDALLKKEVHCAVHSLKDVPAQIPEGLEIDIVPEREDARDVLISKGNRKLEDYPDGATIGTGSLRRGIQLRNRMRGIQIVPIRGNLDTRIRKIEQDGLDGIIVAAAGINRMGWTDRVSQYLPVEVMLPAVGQGALGIESRRDDAETKALLAFLDHEDTRTAVMAERAFLRVFGGGCQLPLAAYARRMNEKMVLVAMVGSIDGSVIIKDQIVASVSKCEAAGKELAEGIMAKGGREIMDEVYGSD
jgi:hydroxymethylbilane synthase